MKKLSIISCLILTVLCSSAQEIKITFRSKSDTVSIDSIRATNLRTEQTVKLLSGENLLLAQTPTNIRELPNSSDMAYLYPNPSSGQTTLSFNLSRNQEVGISVFNSSGQLITRKMQNLPTGSHRFLLGFPSSGIYHILVLNGGKLLNLEAVYTGNTQSTSIAYIGSNNVIKKANLSTVIKSTLIDKTIEFEPGDNLHYTAYSGKNITLISDMPAVSKTLEIEFYSCIDPDGKSYKIVKIGDQVWMAENLAYIPSVSAAPSGSLTEKHYYVNNYNDTDVAVAKATEIYSTYGVLYNWPAAMNGASSSSANPSGVQGVCPAGWHLPSYAEWRELRDFLTNNGYGYEGSGDDIAKSLAAKTNWLNSTTIGTPGLDPASNNNSGFSGLPGGCRTDKGEFSYIGIQGFWWNATELITTTTAWSYFFWYYGPKPGSLTLSKDNGYSVRCVRD